MNAWSTEDGDAMGPTVTRTASSKTTTPPLKNGNDLRESGYLIAVGSRTARFRRKHQNKLLITTLLVILLMLLCVAIAMTVLYVHQKRHNSIRICESKECLRSAANLALSMDKSVDPCNDFYQYSCGNWAEDHPRPDVYRSYDWFRDKQTKVYTAVRDFLVKNITHYPKPVQQAKDMYTACMDTETLDKRGLNPIFTILEELGLPIYPTIINVTDDIDYNNYTFDWLEAVIRVKTKLGMDVLIGFDIYTDPKNSSIYRLMMGSPETTNPFPSMHNERKRHARRRHVKQLNLLRLTKTPTHVFNLISNKKYEYERRTTDDIDGEDERTEPIYKLFYAQLMKLFVLESESVNNLKISEPELDQRILETSEAYYNFSENIYDLEEVNETYVENENYFNLPEYTVDEIQKHTDEIVEINNGTTMLIWKRYLEGVFNISDVKLNFEKDKVILSEDDLKYMSLMAAYLSKTSPAVTELYIWIKVVEVLAVHTTTEVQTLFDKTYVDLHNKGATSSPPRSLRCASAVNDMLGMAVAYAIVDPHFVNVTKPKIQIMLNELKNALAHLVGTTKWMDDNTKLETYKKIIQMKTLIGFPDWLLEEKELELFYKGIEVNAGKHLENMISVIQVKIKSALNKFRESHNYSWATDPTEVNAYHTFQENTITVPMVMLQYPFFDLGLDSLNYGSLGTILGHEITHGFDNYGRLFDRNGNLLPWWTNETTVLYVNMTQCFIEQYSSFYVPELGEHVNGANTLGENIADNGGVREALAALKHHLQKYGPEPKLPGFEDLTSEQLFFLSYGNLWCGITTRESLKADLEDEHSPQQFRATGSLQNIEDFARAWHCPLGSRMNPLKRCIIF